MKGSGMDIGNKEFYKCLKDFLRTLSIEKDLKIKWSDVEEKKINEYRIYKKTS